VKKFLILTFILYILVLLRTSFLVHFNIKGFVFNLILITIIFINFFEERNKLSGIYLAFLGGFFLDIFSEKFFGFYILISIAISIFIKLILKKYVRIPTIKSH